MNEMNLETLGWNDFFEEAFKPLAQEGFSVGRVAVQHRTHYLLYSVHGELRGEVTGKMQYLAGGPEDFPAVGDWVVIHARPEEQAATIHELLPRKSKFSRKVAGAKTEEQVVAANVDVVFIVSGLDEDFNLRRLERYLVLASESGARPVIILNKADLCTDIDKKKRAVEEIAQQAPIHVTSALKDQGLDAILVYLKRGVTGALMGSSGVGKSTIINHLLGREVFKTREVRESDGRGRHTTSTRELVLLPSGGLLIDNPGMRELQLWGGMEGVGEVFADIEELAQSCRFRDCSHDTEPGCAVRKAMETGELSEERFMSYRKLVREIAYQNRKLDAFEQRKEKERIKKIMVAYKKGPHKRDI